MFAVEFAPLLSSQSWSVLGFLAGWLLQYFGWSVRLPIYQHLCMGVALKLFSDQTDLFLLALVPCLYFWRHHQGTKIVLAVLALLWQPTFNVPEIVGMFVHTALWVQAPLRAIPYSCARILTALFWSRQVLTYTALFAEFEGQPMRVLAAFLVVQWCGEWWRVATAVEGVVEWIYYISARRPWHKTQ